jgi:DNA gyrase/topoisomerase IV subunit A
LFALTDNGTGKKCSLDAFATMDRNSKPLRLITLDADENVMIVKTVKGSEVFKAFLKNSIEEIKIDDVTELPRLSKGRKLIPVRKGEVIIDVKEKK